MEAHVVAVLLERHRAGDRPITARELLALLKLPKTEKSRLNSLLYTTAAAHAAHANPLGLPKQYRIVKHPTSPPQWCAIHKAEDELAEPRLRCAWAMYEALAAHPATAVSVSAILDAHPDVLSLACAVKCLREHTLSPGERVDVSPPCSLTLHIPTVERIVEHVVLNCDTVVGARRDHAQCIVLGMAILECMAANPGKRVSLLTRDPGTHTILRHVLKTNEYARSLDLVVDPIPAPSRAPAALINVNE